MSDWYPMAIQFVSCVLEGYCLYLLCRNFLSPKIGEGGGREALAGLFWFFLRMAGSYVECGINGMALALKSLFYWGFLFLFCILYYQGKAAYELFTAAMFLSLREMAFFAAYSLMGVGTWCTDMLVHVFEKGWVGEGEFLTAVNGVANVSLFCECLIDGFLLYFGILFLLKIMPGGCGKKEGRELLFCMLPAEASLLVGFILRMLMFFTEEGEPRILYQKYPILYGIVPVVSLMLYASVLFNTWLYQKVCEKKEQDKEQEILRNQITQMQGAMEEMERLYDGIRGVRHDMKNQMLALKGILHTSGDREEELRGFLSDMYRSVEQLDYGLHTGNSVCDVVIGSKFAYAKKHVPPVRLNADNFLVESSWGVRAYDLGIMLNNGLDNAIEAIERMRKSWPEKEAYITVKSYVRSGMVFIEMENSFSGSLQFEGGNPLPLSSKDGEGHGMGLRNIRNCAGKYGGAVDCIVQGEKFILSIMIGGRQMRSIFRTPSDDLEP